MILGSDEAAKEIASRLVDRRLTAVMPRENDWVFSFEGDVVLMVGAAWRLVVEGRNAFGSDDHGHQFGLPDPVDGVERTERNLGGRAVTALSVRTTGDLTIDFEGGSALEIFQTSCGYEAWELRSPGLMVVCQGGGQLAVWVS